MNSKIASSICACLLFAVSALADSPASFTIIPANNSAVYNVFYKSAEAGRVRITISNSANQIVFSEILNNVTSFKRPYNFMELEQGEYTITLEDKHGKQVEKVKYFMNEITSFVRVSQIPGASDKYLVNVATNGQETVNVKIYSNKHELLHEEHVKISGNYGVVFNLSQVKASLAPVVIFEVTTGSGKTETAMF